MALERATPHRPPMHTPPPHWEHPAHLEHTAPTLSSADHRPHRPEPWVVPAVDVFLRTFVVAGMALLLLMGLALLSLGG